MIGKKAITYGPMNWVEIWVVLLIVIGFLISLTIESLIFNIIVIFLAGFMGGVLLFEKNKRKFLFPYILIIIGFLFGFMLGTFTHRKIIAFTFVAGVLIGYYIYEKGYLK